MLNLRMVATRAWDQLEVLTQNCIAIIVELEHLFFQFTRQHDAINYYMTQKGILAGKD